MSWTYQFDEIDKEVTKDQSTPGRFTFNRYMYFKPSEYENWSTKSGYSPNSYTAELVNNSNLPAIGTALTGPLSSFYLRDYISITNLIEEEHKGHCSYAKVTLEYENRPAQSDNDSVQISWGAGKSDPQPQPHPEVETQPARYVEPWEQYVEDLSVINQEIQVPWTKGYLLGTGNKIPITTTAGQPLYGMTTSEWIQKISWTVNTRDDTDYSISAAVINDEEISISSGGIVIPAGQGLLLPPNRKFLYFNNDVWVNEKYSQWSFEIIRNPNGFMTEILNAGTQYAPDSSSHVRTQRRDICSWYVYDPSSTSSPPTKEYGNFNDMMAAKKEVDAYNKTVHSEEDKKVWSGDFVQNPIPLDAYGNIDWIAISSPSQTYELFFYKYKFGTWNILFR